MKYFHLRWVLCASWLLACPWATTAAQEIQDFSSSPQSVDVSFGGGTISGRVTSSVSGLPLTGVEVYAKFQGLPGAARVETNFDGRYEISLFSGGTWFVYTRDRDNNTVGQLYSGLECIDPGRVCAIENGDPVVVPNGGSVDGIDFILDLGGVISGTFEEATTGFNAGAFQDISLFDANGFLVATAFTSMRNTLTSLTFRTYPVPAGDYFVVAGDAGYREQLYPLIDCDDFSCDPTLGSAVSVVAGATSVGIDFSVTVDAAQGGAFAGTVTPDGVDDLFSPFVRAWDPVSQSFLGDTITRGGYVVAGLPGASVRSTVFESGYARQLYDALPCSGTGFPACNIGPGTPISITDGVITPGIDYVLSPREIFEDGFESGGTTAWSTTVD